MSALLLLRAVTAASLLAVADALGVQRAANDLVTDPPQETGTSWFSRRLHPFDLQVYPLRRPPRSGVSHSASGRAVITAWDQGKRLRAPCRTATPSTRSPGPEVPGCQSPFGWKHCLP